MRARQTALLVTMDNAPSGERELHRLPCLSAQDFDQENEALNDSNPKG